MSWSAWVRQVHRWLAIAFALAVMVNLVAVVRSAYATWVGALALVPLVLLLVTGLFLFVLPYATRWRTGRRVVS